MKEEFWKRHNKLFWLLAISLWIITVGLIIYCTNPIVGDFRQVASLQNTAQPNITLVHTDKDGTIWVGIEGNLYYLYISDNGTQKRLEMK